jgi:protein NrfD
MSLSSILFLFLTHLGVGITLVLAWVGREAGVKFFRFNAGTAALLIAIGFTLRPAAPAEPGPLHLASTGLLLVCEAALVIYWATIGRMLAKIRPALLWTAIISGLLAISVQALEISANAPGLAAVLTVCSFLSSAALLGGACGAMVLGHWYLVVPSLDVAHLQSIVKLHIVSMVVRAVVVVAAVTMAVVTWQPGMGPNFLRYILSSGGIFFWQRVLFGLVGPAVLAYMTWETAKIQSTQSATGILYVDFFTVIVGEVLAKYLLLSTNIPV